MKGIRTILAAGLLIAAGCTGNSIKEHRFEDSKMSRIPAHLEYSKPQKTLVLPKPKEVVPVKSGPDKDTNAPAKIDIGNVKTGSTIIFRKPGQPALSDGSSVVQSVFSGIGNNADQPKDSVEPGKEKTGTAEEKSKDVPIDKKKPETPLAPSRQPDKKNCVYLIGKGASRERFDAIAFAAKEKLTNAVPVLGGVLKEETRFSAAAAEALSAIGGSRAASALYSEVERGVVPDMRLTAFSALLSMNDPSEDRYLVKCFSHKDATIRYWAVQAAAVRSLPAAQPQIRAILDDTKQPNDIRVWAAAGIERVSPGDSQARSVLLSALHNRSLETAATAMDALAAIGSAWSVGEIAGLLYSDDTRVAGNILELLCRIEPASALAALENASGGYRNTPRYKTTRMAILGTPDHTAIAEAVMSQDALARSLAIEEAAHFKSETAVPALAALARSTSGGAEHDHAVAALKAIGNTEAKDTLTALGESPASTAPAAPQFRVTRVYNDGMGGLKGVMISDGKQEFMCTPGQESSYGWTLKGIEQGQALLENKDGRKLSLPVPVQP